MRMIRNFDSTSTGFIDYDPAPRVDIPFQTRIRCYYMGTTFVMFDVSPWGTVLPYMEGMEDVVKYHFEIETLYMPKDTVLGIRWSPRSGNNSHVLSHTLPGDGNTNSRFQIDHAWLKEAQGEDVQISFEVNYPDGSTEAGRGFEVRIGRHHEFGRTFIGDLTGDDPLNPDKYPDGLPVRIDPIINVEAYSNIRFLWQARGYIGNGYYKFSEWSTSIPCAPGKGYDFIVPPEAYNGLNVPDFDRFEIQVAMFISLAPEPVPEFNYGMGGRVIPIDYDAK